jgi:disulfide bond formation protein DsbB
MTMQNLPGKLGFWAQIAFIGAYVGILSTAMFVFQFGMNEMPCPLCITQRMAMIAASLGPVYIVTQALRNRLVTTRFMVGLGMATVGAVVGAIMSTRQVELHILPGDPGYGTAIMGMHLYTWALVTFVVVLVFAGALLLFGTEFQPVAPDARWARTLAWIIVWAFIATIAINMVVVFIEEGFTMYLPDDPTGYVLLQQLGITK